MLHVEIDASDVPADYILSILSQCSTFPEVLIFFLKGHLTARYFWVKQRMAVIDTYFMISCTDGGTVPAGEPPALKALGAAQQRQGRSSLQGGRRAVGDWPEIPPQGPL